MYCTYIPLPRATTSIRPTAPGNFTNPESGRSCGSPPFRRRVARPRMSEGKAVSATRAQKKFLFHGKTWSADWRQGIAYHSTQPAAENEAAAVTAAMSREEKPQVPMPALTPTPSVTLFRGTGVSQTPARNEPGNVKRALARLEVECTKPAPDLGQKQRPRTHSAPRTRSRVDSPCSVRTRTRFRVWMEGCCIV